jgi:hypothetical protein
MEGRSNIVLAGVNYPLVFGYLSTKTLQQDPNKAMYFTPDGGITDIGYAKIAYTGYQDYCLSYNVPVALSFGEFAKEFDKVMTSEGGVEIVSAIMKVWAESENVQDLIKQNEEKKSLMTEESTLRPLSESPTVS